LALFGLDSLFPLRDTHNDHRPIQDLHCRCRTSWSCSQRKILGECTYQKVDIEHGSWTLSLPNYSWNPQCSGSQVCSSWSILDSASFWISLVVSLTSRSIC